MSSSLPFLFSSLPLSTKPATDDSVWMSRLRKREAKTWSDIRSLGIQPRHHLSERATYVHDDVLAWLANFPVNSVHAIVTDPPFGVIEYDDKNQSKLRKGR